jgi:hypothetical protein
VILQGALRDHHEVFHSVLCQVGLHREERKVHQVLEGGPLAQLDAVRRIEIHLVDSP